MKRWLLALLLLLASSSRAATWTICASGCSGQTFALALLAATTDTAAVLDLQANTTEAVGVTQSIAEIKSSNGSILTNNTGAATLSFTSGATGTMSVHDITIRHTTSAGNCIIWAALGSGATLFLKEGLVVDQQTDSNGVVVNFATTTANQFRMNRVTLDGNAAGGNNNRGLQLNGGVNNGSFETNCLFKRWGRSGIASTADNGAGSFTLSVGNNTFYQCGTITTASAALRIAGNFRAVNNLILGGSSSQADVSFTGSAVCGMETNSLHGNTTPTPCGTPAVIVGVSPTNVFVNPGTDFRLLPGSAASNAGVTVTWIPTADLNGTPMAAGSWSMGAIQNIATATFTPTPTITTTFSISPTFSVSPTFTPTNTVTATLTSTPTATPTFSSTVTPTSSRTSTSSPTATPTPTFTGTSTITPNLTQTAIVVATQTAQAKMGNDFIIIDRRRRR